MTLRAETTFALAHTRWHTTRRERDVVARGYFGYVCYIHLTSTHGWPLFCRG